MSRGYDEGDRVRSLDEEHRAAQLLGTVLACSCDGDSGLVAVCVRWDNGHEQCRLGEEVELLEQPASTATGLFVNCPGRPTRCELSFAEALTWAKHYGTEARIYEESTMREVSREEATLALVVEQHCGPDAVLAAQVSP